MFTYVTGHLYFELQLQAAVDSVVLISNVRRAQNYSVVTKMDQRVCDSMNRHYDTGRGKKKQRQTCFFFFLNIQCSCTAQRHWRKATKTNTGLDCNSSTLQIHVTLQLSPDYLSSFYGSYFQRGQPGKTWPKMKFMFREWKIFRISVQSLFI